MAEIKCPVCGQLNSSDARACSNCGSALHEAIQPGDLPTHKTTSELEPILPQWLREAQEKAVKSTGGELRDPSKSPQAPAERPDLLAGLDARSREDAEDDIPDWLSNITGEKAKKKSPPDASIGTRVELGGREQDPGETPESLEEGELPAWLAALSSPHAESGGAAEPQDWMDQAASRAPGESTEVPPGNQEPSRADEAPAVWPAEEDLLAGLPGALEAELPDWLKNAEPGQPAMAEPSDLPDWLQGLESDAAPPGSAGEEMPALEQGDLPEWLDRLDADVPIPPAHPAPEEPPVEPPPERLPMWLESLDADVPVPPVLRPLPEEAPPALPLEQAEDLTDEFAHPPSESEAVLPGARDVELPDWLLEMGKPSTAEAAEETGLPDWLTPPAGEEMPAEEPQESLPAGGLESLFTDVPDWIGEAASEAPPAEAPVAEEPESLLPGSLPSWVQAMRPMEAGIRPAGQGVEDEQRLESAGPLAGLRGVLPPVLYAGATSRPQAQSARLQVSQEQQGHADLLEQILLTEARPEPMIGVPRVAAWRSLRIGIGVLLFVLLLASVFAGSQAFPVPIGRPREAMAALNAIESLPQNAPVLLVFDYEPALAGEMEAAAAPLLDHLIVLKAPRLTLLSTSPTGAALADRMFSGPLGQLGIRPGMYANLGYLPGGLNGVRSFAQNPSAAMPIEADMTAPWDPVASGIRGIADYAAVIVITDSSETGRIWIEQAAPLYGGRAFLLIASAQAGPMLQPYYQSGQLNGLSTGLFDAAILEQSNASRPGIARRYWDAYNLGLMAAVLLLTTGGVWSLVSGIRARRLEEAGSDAIR
ncbi:MAG: hypothetical protein ACM3QS_13365 [Bacteroidota bacterium]